MAEGLDVDAAAWAMVNAITSLDEMAPLGPEAIMMLTMLHLRAAYAAGLERAAVIAETYFQPCDQPADISARECGEQTAAAIRQAGRDGA